MKFLIVSHYFWPETFIVNELADHLASTGHSVTVLTGKPNYPDGQIFDGYRASGIQHEALPSGVQIHRIPLRPRKSGKAINLALNYLSFLFSGLVRFPGMIKGQSYDAILFFAPSPMTSAITAIPLKYLKQAHLAVWVQDLWPESLSATGHVANPLILFIIKQIVRLIYRFSDTLLIQSRAFHEPVSRLADGGKIVYFPNFSSVLDAESQHESAALPQSLLQLLENNFCIVFSGNLGTAQALHTVIGAANLLSDLPQCKILLVGSGSMSGWLEQQIKEKNLQNVILTGRLPVEQMPALYQRTQGLLVSLDNEEIFSYTVPSKVQGYLAAGRPIIAAINGEAAKIIQESGAGLTGMAEDISALAENIRKLYYLTPEQRAAMGAQGYKYFKEHFEMESQIPWLVETLRQRIVNKKA